VTMLSLLPTSLSPSAPDTPPPPPLLTPLANHDCCCCRCLCRPPLPGGLLLLLPPVCLWSPAAVLSCVPLCEKPMRADRRANRPCLLSRASHISPGDMGGGGEEREEVCGYV
jgi:hypothetical protein